VRPTNRLNLGVVLAHSLINIGMVVAWPFLDAWLNQVLLAQMSTTIQVGLWLLIAIGLGLFVLKVRDAMNMEHLPRLEPDSSQAHQQVTLGRIEQVIDRIGARYIADLRMLSEESSRFYEAQLIAKDKQIAELSRRLEVAERERDALEAQKRELKRTSTKYIVDLRALSEELSRYKDGTED